MPRIELPSPTLRLGRAEARRFLLAHQHLWPPRALASKAGILDFIRHVACIQYDPVNLVGQNPELVLQARVADYTPALLGELLYTDRRLVDGWDKQASIHLVEDWPYFARHRERSRREHGDPANPPMAIAAAVMDAIRERGPLCSADLGHDDTIDWWWGVPTRLGRAALEILYGMGELGVHHRVEHAALLRPDRAAAARRSVGCEPTPTRPKRRTEDWHVARRVGSLGLANPAAGEYWLGMGGMKAEPRRAMLARLSAQGVLIPVAVEGIAQAPLFIRASDVSLLDLAAGVDDAPPAATFIGPLDNLIWDRDLIRWLFDFDYTWEVYKPAAQRKYGHYVLPVLYGDRFIARVEPIFDRKARVLTVVNWWWEVGVAPDDALVVALVECLAAFGRYLGAEEVRLGAALVGDWMLERIAAQLS